MPAADLTLWAACQLTAATPAYAQNDGSWESIGDNGVGDFQLVLNAQFGIDSSVCYPSFSTNGALAASQLTTFGFVNTSDTSKQCTVLREGAAGAVSALADVNFFLVLTGRVLI